MQSSRTLITSGLLIILVLFYPLFTAKAFSEAIIIDHNSVSLFDQIPAQYLTLARNQRLLLQHASIGELLSNALNTLASQYSDGRYNRSNIIFENRGNPGWREKVDQFTQRLQYLADNNYLSSYAILGHKFCYIDPDANWTYYRDQQIAAENFVVNRFPSQTKTIMWWTIPIMTSGNGDYARRNTFNANVRSYIKSTNNRILFDIADIESNGQLTNGVEYQLSQWSSDGGHPDDAGSLRIAKALWVMLARTSGWNPGQISTPTVTQMPSATPIIQITPTPQPGDITHDGKIDSADIAVYIQQAFTQSIFTYNQIVALFGFGH